MLNLHEQIKAKIQGGQLFVPNDNKYQCLNADGDQ